MRPEWLQKGQGRASEDDPLADFACVLSAVTHRELISALLMMVVAKRAAALRIVQASVRRKFEHVTRVLIQHNDEAD
jgi:hypothetical protein